MLEHNSLIDLSVPMVLSAQDMAYVKITGEESAKFLQGQVTVDVPSMVSGDIRFTAQCDAKGKMVGLGFLYHVDNQYFYIQDKASAKTSLAQFQKFGVFSKVEFALNDENEQCIAAIKDNGNLADNALLVTPELPNITDTQLLWLPRDTVSTDSELSFSLLLIQQGIPLLKDNMSEQWVPQMMNVQALAGIDFDKGCYMGQEVVARTKYLGKNKRALYTYVLNAQAANLPQVGESVYRRLGDNWRKAGTVVNVAALHGESWISVVLPNDVTASDEIKFNEDSQDLARCSALPYVVESEESSIKMRKRT